MTREQLLESASTLKQPGKAAVSEYAEKQEMLAAEINQIMRARADVQALVGRDNLAMMEDNHRNHARFMESLFRSYEPAVLVNTVLWVCQAYRAHGFQLTYWPAQLDTWVDLLRRHLTPQSFDEIYPFYNWMIVHQAAFVTLSDETTNDKT